MQYLNKAFGNKDPTQEINQVAIAHLLCRFLCTQEAITDDDLMKEPEILTESPYSEIINYLSNIGIPIMKRVDKGLFSIIQNNSWTKTLSDEELNRKREQLIEFATILKHIQHYNFHTKSSLSHLLGKLLTRISFIIYSNKDDN